VPDEIASDPILSAWLEAHAQLKTWSAELVQTRHLAALAQPLVSTGQVYYCKPGLFRWELGQPAETIAVRSTNELWLIYPGLKRAERYLIDPNQAGPMRDALTLMEAGFPRDEETLRKQYRIATQSLTNGLSSVVLEPRSSSAKRLIGRVSLTFQTNVFTLASSEIEFADGSRLENQFRHGESNEPLPPGTFSNQVPSDFKVVEPLKP